MKTRIHPLHKALAVLVPLAGLAMPVTGWASLLPFQSYTGNVALSTDGFGSTSNSGNISATVPSGSTVLAAYLYSATFSGTSAPTVTLNGTAVSFGPQSLNPNGLGSFRADVTSIVSPTINGGAGGVYNFNYAETALGGSTDGSALVVVYKNAALPEASVAILDGFTAVSGDTTTVNFADPLDPSDPAFFAEMRLGISFSCCGQASRVTVNGTTITNVAGNNDDGLQVANGSLITVGGDNDPFSPLLPSYADDHERYNLKDYVALGDTSIQVDTLNPSTDDNIFLAAFYVSGKAGFNEPPPDDEPPTGIPEPTSLALLSLGMLGVIGSNRKKRA